MNWDRVEGQWKQRRGKAVNQWGKLMNDELAAIAGKHELLVGILQEKYGVAKEDARRQMNDFKKTVGELKKANAKLISLQQSLSKELKAHRTRKNVRKSSAKAAAPKHPAPRSSR